MAVTAEQVRVHIGAGTTEVPTTVLDAHLALAALLLTEHYGTAVVPDAVKDRAQLLVAAELFNQDQSPNGFLNQQFDTEDGVVAAPIRVSSDPLRAVYALTAPWVGPSIA